MSDNRGEYRIRVEALRARGREMLRRDARWRRLLQLGFILGGATLTGVCEVLLNSENLLPGVRGSIQTLWFVGLFLILLAGVILAYIDQTAPEVLAEADLALAAARKLEEDSRQSTAVEMARLEQLAQSALSGVDEAEQTIIDMADDIERMQEAGLRLGTLYSLTRSALLEGVEAIVIGRSPDKEQRRALAVLVLDSFGLFSNRLFGFLDEYWSLTILTPVREPDGVDRLTCYATRRSSRNDEQRTHRTWERGEGCAGLAWEAAEERVIPDIEVEQTLRVRKANQHRGDSSRHRSLAAVPIMVGSEVVGVLCASSSVANRFIRSAAGEPPSLEIDTVEPLRAIASHLAILFALTHLDDSIPQSAPHG